MLPTMQWRIGFTACNAIAIGIAPLFIFCARWVKRTANFLNRITPSIVLNRATCARCYSRRRAGGDLEHKTPTCAMDGPASASTEY